MTQKEKSYLLQHSLQEESDHLFYLMKLPVRPPITLNLDIDVCNLSPDEAGTLPLVQEHRKTGAYRIYLYGDDPFHHISQLTQAAWVIYCQFHHCHIISEQVEFFENYYRHFIRKEPLPDERIFPIGNNEIPLYEICELIRELSFEPHGEIKIKKDWRII